MDSCPRIFAVHNIIPRSIACCIKGVLSHSIRPWLYANSGPGYEYTVCVTNFGGHHLRLRAGHPSPDMSCDIIIPHRSWILWMALFFIHCTNSMNPHPLHLTITLYLHATPSLLLQLSTLPLSLFLSFHTVATLLLLYVCSGWLALGCSAIVKFTCCLSWSPF